MITVSRKFTLTTTQVPSTDAVTGYVIGLRPVPGSGPGYSAEQSVAVPEATFAGVPLGPTVFYAKAVGASGQIGAEFSQQIVIEALPGDPIAQVPSGFSMAVA